MSAEELISAFTKGYIAGTKAMRENAIELLKELEWAGNLTDYDESWGVITIACPWCRNSRKDGHKPNCKLAEMLKVLP
jgi:hypothetical protein